ncbi:plastocyanin/azurin family copper-binding protein [Haladaptatus sp. F3-133]|uniref:Plastocyanin/azurin family copper-binding protein n=1 Tax=Halorutilus salinus TaxID=2487751 RepID=A0A9Q4GGJ7_9EURY|nr:plastocyanin/azurin family copper-binding protein [Halorutilus salinus]MCX2818767.1 plastocyanin/azurin family copper-binding protein [Halorutilus salinus]
MKKTTSFAIFIIFLAITATAVGTASATNHNTADYTGQDEVVIEVGPDGTWSFEPENVQISKGTTVIWQAESAGHNVVHNPQSGEPIEFRSGSEYEIMEAGETFQHTFDQTGTYNYICEPHESQQTGTIEVVDNTEDDQQSSTTRITDVVPKQETDTASGINDIEVGETMVVRGVTNRQPSETAIVVEATEGPTIASVPTAVTDDWGSDGEWSVEMDISEDVEPGRYTFQSDDGDRIDEATVNIVDPAPAEFNVVSADLPDEAEPGERISIDGTVRNVGDENTQQGVSYRFDGREVSTDRITLDGGQSEEVSFSYRIPSSTNDGTYTHGIYTDDDSSTSTIRVTTPQEPAELEVSSFSLPGEAEPGGIVNAEAEVENIGDESASRYIEYRFDGQTRDRERVTLNGGETGTVDFSYTIPSSLEDGDYEQSIHTGDSTSRQSITVQSNEELEEDLEAADDPDDDEGTEDETEQTQGTPQGGGGSATADLSPDSDGDSSERESGLITTPNWDDRKLLPGGASVPIDNLNNPTTLTVMGIVISVLGILLQLTMMRV